MNFKFGLKLLWILFRPALVGLGVGVAAGYFLCWVKVISCDQVWVLGLGISALSIFGTVWMVLSGYLSARKANPELFGKKEKEGKRGEGN